MTEEQNFELSYEYKIMIDHMLDEENDGTARYVFADEINNRFLNQRGDL